MSNHIVEVVPLDLSIHPNADRLLVAKVHGYTCVTAKDQWEGKDRAAYIPPDSLVDVTRPEFKFLEPKSKNGIARIKAVKVRGVLSFGLLVPVNTEYPIGSDVASALGVTHYEPPLRRPSTNVHGVDFGGEAATPPSVVTPKYDLESGRRYAHKVFVDNEPVCITEKIHGCVTKTANITMADGSSKLISQIRVGERVLSYNRQGCVFESKRVTATPIMRDKDLRVRWLRITLMDGSVLTITSNHLVLTDTGWVEAGSLKPEDNVVCSKIF